MSERTATEENQTMTEPYPDPDSDDLADAIEAAATDNQYTRYVRGRYTAYRTFTTFQTVNKTGNKESAIVVKDCEQNTILSVPVETAHTTVRLLRDTDYHKR